MEDEEASGVVVVRFTTRCPEKLRAA